MTFSHSSTAPVPTQAARRRASRASAAVVAAALLLCTAAPARADAVRDKQYWLQDYGVTEAWKSTQGEGVKVAVIDSGVDGSHPDLSGAVAGGIDASGAGRADGQQGIGEVPEHGTLVSTLLAGRGHGPRPTEGAAPSPLAAYGEGPDGIVGVAPKADLLAVSVWIEGPNSGPNPAGIGTDEQIPNAVRWAVDNGAKVINMSLGSTSTTWPESWDEAFLYAEKRDVVIVAAAGNRAGGLTQVGAPATIPGVLSVAGLDRSGVASRESSSEGISIAVAAPSENLVGGLPGAFYAEWSGTSGAAPLVSGVAALIRSKYPELSAAQVVNRIVGTARDAGAPGFDTIYGHGILDVAAAVGPGVEVPKANQLGSMEQWIQVYRRGKPPAEAAPPAPAENTAAPDIPAAPVPQAHEGAGSSTVLPPVVVLGFSGLFVLLLVGGTVHVLRVRRAERLAPQREEPDTGAFDVPQRADRPAETGHGSPRS
ncbi:peptidase S8 [Arthrobacter crusticola]|uniref:Peptidase S8 n=1 Tax=Arthrobacter crusticola TaxID=2547960 RepID=A0A4R5TZP6_9MICC|nr:S8 family serine peptidase [Arthrobacter crusticola]TDK26764.1 peptidase S8 [Arthrobacter crusticola]